MLAHFPDFMTPLLSPCRFSSFLKPSSFSDSYGMSPGYIFIIVLWFPIVSTAAPKIYSKSYKIIHYLSLCLHEDIYLGRYLEISSSPPSLNWQLFRPFRFCHRFWNPLVTNKWYFSSKFSIEITNLLSYFVLFQN